MSAFPGRFACGFAVAAAIALAACAPEPAPGAATTPVADATPAATSTPLAPAAAATPAPAPADPAANAATVRAFVAAFDRHDVDALVALAHPEISWLSLQAEQLTPELHGTKELHDWLVGYYARVPGARSRLVDVGPGGRFVSAYECAGSPAANGAFKEECAASMYEIEDGKVRRLWYFPGEPPAQ